MSMTVLWLVLQEETAKAKSLTKLARIKLIHKSQTISSISEQQCVGNTIMNTSYMCFKL